MPVPPKTHCANEHEYTPENTLINSQGKRVCLTCKRANGRVADRARRESRRAYMRQYQAEWVAARRSEYLRSKKCVRCGSADRLEIDHVSRSDKSEKLKRGRGTTSQIWSWSEERRIAELAKCQVLCHDCHTAKTADEWAAQAQP